MEKLFPGTRAPGAADSGLPLQSRPCLPKTWPSGPKFTEVLYAPRPLQGEDQSRLAKDRAPSVCLAYGHSQRTHTASCPSLPPPWAPTQLSSLVDAPPRPTLWDI